MFLLYHSVVASSVFSGLWVLPGINPQAVHGHREFQALQCALTRHETACESRVKIVLGKLCMFIVIFCWLRKRLQRIYNFFKK